MDAVTATLVVAGIVGGAGVVQGCVQGWLASRGAAVSARQEAARAGIAHVDDLLQKLTDLILAEETYRLEAGPSGFGDDKVRELEITCKLRAAYLRVYAAIAALPGDSPSRFPAHRAAAILLATLGGELDARLFEPNTPSRKVVAEALAELGADRDYRYMLLESAPRPWWARRAARKGHRSQRTKTHLAVLVPPGDGSYDS